jgi:hypothetical protein
MAENLGEKTIKFIKIPPIHTFMDLKFVEKKLPDPLGFDHSKYQAIIKGLDCGTISIIYGFGAYGKGPETDCYEIWIMNEWDEPRRFVSSNEIDNIIKNEWVRTVYKIF